MFALLVGESTLGVQGGVRQDTAWGRGALGVLGGSVFGEGGKGGRKMWCRRLSGTRGGRECAK